MSKKKQLSGKKTKLAKLPLTEALSRQLEEAAPDLPAAVPAKQFRKAFILQIAAKQGAKPRAGDAKWKAGGAVAGKYEDIGKQFAHRFGLDFAAVRRPRTGSLLVPICEELLV